MNFKNRHPDNIQAAFNSSLGDSIRRKNAMPASKGRDQIEAQIDKALGFDREGKIGSAAVLADEIACRLICMAA